MNTELPAGSVYDQSPMDEFKCHKRVKAARITVIQAAPTMCVDLHLEDILDQVTVSPEWFSKHCPQVGGYYVLYADGYASYSPAQAFEEGYLKVEPMMAAGVTEVSAPTTQAGPHDECREARDVIPGTMVHINGIPLFTVGIATLSTHSNNWPLTGATCVERNIAPHPESPGSTPTPDSTIEQEIQAKGLTAPRVTPADIEANIDSEYYFTAYEGYCGQGDGLHMSSHDSLDLLTFCVIVLKNGFTVTGESACASPENFDAELGRKIARQNAVSKMWPLMGYALKQKLFEGLNRPQNPEDNFRVRLMKEHSELQVRHEKLGLFIGTEAYLALPEVDRTDLQRQHVHMREYLDVLTRRVSRLCNNG